MPLLASCARVLAGGALMTVLSTASATVLYDAGLATFPDVQGMTFASAGPAPVRSMVTGATRLDTTGDHSTSAGYGRLAPVPLSLAGVFSVSFTLQVLSEAHTSNDRAGFSVIVISNDPPFRIPPPAPLGIEIGFWTDRIWAQNSGFTHGEEALFDTRSMAHLYELTVMTTGYILKADGNSILQGDLRAYGSPTIPYAIRNSLFFGDDTTSARADACIGAIGLNEANPAAPDFNCAARVSEPLMGPMLLAGLIPLAAILRRRYRSPAERGR